MPASVLFSLYAKNFNYKRKVKKTAHQNIVLQGIVTLILLIKNL